VNVRTYNNMIIKCVKLNAFLWSPPSPFTRFGATSPSTRSPLPPAFLIKIILSAATRVTRSLLYEIIGARNRASLKSPAYSRSLAGRDDGQRL